MIRPAQAGDDLSLSKPRASGDDPPEPEQFWQLTR